MDGRKNNGGKREGALVLWEAPTHKDIGDNCIMTFVSIVETATGKNAIMRATVDGNNVYLFYMPHFFSRYAQRFGNLRKLNVYGSSKEGIAYKH